MKNRQTPAPSHNASILYSLPSGVVLQLCACIKQSLPKEKPHHSERIVQDVLLILLVLAGQGRLSGDPDQWESDLCYSLRSGKHRGQLSSIQPLLKRLIRFSVRYYAHLPRS